MRKKTLSLKLANPVATYIVHHQAYQLKRATNAQCGNLRIFLFLRLYG